MDAKIHQPTMHRHAPFQVYPEDAGIPFIQRPSPAGWEFDYLKTV
jgi:hypothetical protein